MNFPKKLIAILALLPSLAMAEITEYPFKAYDKAPERTSLASLQNGAKLFVNHCLNCHEAASMRYNRLRDLGLTEEQIKTNLLFSGDKVGDMMTTAMKPADAKAWFGVKPPDLSVIARAKSDEHGSGADYLYTYLRTFYKDDSRPTGWNNLVLHNAAMPHVLWELQGVRTIKMKSEKDEHDPSKTEDKFDGFEQVKPGKLSEAEYDTAVADLVGYMSWMAEPSQGTRKRLGVWVLLFMTGFALLAWRLNASFWKEVK
jgi:ubiquinol-cytochrome c reductase cytochrome c1 subunit